MSIISTADALYTYKFLRLMTTKWEDLNAYKLGIIDDNGKLLKKTSKMNSEEKSEYTLFHRLVFNLKRALEKLPINKRFSSYAAALYLLKENYGVLDSAFSSYITLNEEFESKMWFINEDVSISPGIYRLNENIISPITGNTVQLKGTSVKVVDCQPQGTIFSNPIYKVKSNLNEQSYYVTANQLER